MTTFIRETIGVIDAACHWLAIRLNGDAVKAYAVWTAKIDKLLVK